MSEKIGDAIIIDGMAFSRYTGPEKYYTEEDTRLCPICGEKIDIQDETTIKEAIESPLYHRPAIYARLSVYACGAVIYYRRYDTMLNIIAMRDHSSSPLYEDIASDDSETI